MAEKNKQAAEKENQKANKNAANNQLDDDLLDDDQSTNTEQYITFFLNKEAFAFSMNDVREIIRVPKSVEVPLTSASLVGLSNLRGSVLPILDLRRLLQVTEKDNNDSTRVIVADCNGTPVGLIVDRVSRVINVGQEQIEGAETIRSTIDADLIQGVVKNVDGHSLIQLLEAKKTVGSEFESVMQAAKMGGSVDISHDSANSDIEVDDDTTQLVCFVVDGQEYAFNIKEVEEIVRIPDDISSVPKTDQHVLGIISLREELLPLVNLRSMFGLAQQEITDINRILVVNIFDALGDKIHSVGIVVDNVKDVLRITDEEIDKVPALLCNGDDLNDIIGICRLDDGKRLVSILSSESLFDNPTIQNAVQAKASVNNGEDNNMNNDLLDEGDETQLVTFSLGNQEFAISIEAVQKITRVPEEMNKVPKTADFIEGMVNLSGAVLPVMDMRARFGMERMERSDRQRILVLSLNGTATGFITDSVTEVLRLSKSLIEDSPNLSAEQSKVMGKVVNLKEKNRIIQVLDPSQLLDQNQAESLAIM
jgi:purine-binding chemotaxis protein CheW